MKLRLPVTKLKLFGLMSVMTGVFLGAGLLLGGRSGLIIALVFAGLTNFASYWFSHRIVLRIHGAEEIPEGEMEWLRDAVKEFSDNAGIPEPDLYRSNMRVPNAFATGRNPEHGVVCFTEPLLKKLDRNEVKGVLAHEMAHIENRDTLTNSVVATLAGAVAVLADMAFWGAMFSGGEERGNLASAAVMMVLTPLIATLVRSAVSRTMEFRADSDAVRIHGERDGLASGLKKINAASERSRYTGSKVEEASASLFIDNPFTGDRLARWFSTHPPLQDRLENIRSTEP